MTANEMKYAVQVLYDSIDSDNAPSFLDSEWAVILTQAQYDVVMDIVNSGVSKTDFNRSALRGIIKKARAVNFTQVTDDSVYYPNGYYATDLDLTASSVWIPLITTADTATKGNVKVDIIEQDFYLKNRYNPFRKPGNEYLFWAVYEDGGMIIIGDGSEPTKFKMSYIKDIEAYPITPDDTSPVNCVLDESVHRLIVKKAASLANLYVSDFNAYQAHTLESKSPGILYPFK